MSSPEEAPKQETPTSSKPTTPAKTTNNDIHNIVAKTNETTTKKQTAIRTRSDVVQQDTDSDNDNNDHNHHHHNENNNNNDDDDDDEDFHDEEANTIEQVATVEEKQQQQPLQHLPSPPKIEKNSKQNQENTHSGEELKLPPINNKKGAGVPPTSPPSNSNKKEIGERKKSIAFKQKVANHQFRDDDNSKPNFKVDRHPKEIRRASSEHSLGDRKQSLAFKQKAAKHQFRSDDKSKPDFKVDRHPTSPTTTNNNNNGGGKQSARDTSPGKAGRKQSMAFHQKVAKHQFRDDDKSKPDIKVDRHQPSKKKNEDGDTTTPPTSPRGDRKKSMAFHQKVAKHQFRDDDNSKPNFKVDRHPTELQSTKKPSDIVADPSAKNEKDEGYDVVVKARNHRFRDFDDDNNKNNKSNQKDNNNGDGGKTTTTQQQQPHHRARDKVRNYQEVALKKAQEAEAKKQAQGKVAPTPGTTTEEDEKTDRKQVLKKRQSTVAMLHNNENKDKDNNNKDDDIDTTFPRQPRCNPENLEVPVTRITDLLWDKYVINNATGTETFPINKLSTVYTKIWPSHDLKDDYIEMASEAMVSDRSAEKKKGLPADGLTHKEFNLCNRTVALINNWFKQKTLDEEKTPKVLDIEAFAVVADRVKVEKIAKTFMDLTDNRGDETTLGKLAKHLAAQQKRGISSHLLLATESMRGRRPDFLNDDNNNADFGQSMNTPFGGENDDDDERAKHLPKFPRQPKCDPNDLTLPTARILSLMFKRYAAYLPEEEPVSTTTKLFPTSKMYGAMQKIWPGNAVPKDFTEDAIDVLMELRDEEKEKWEKKKNAPPPPPKKDDDDDDKPSTADSNDSSRGESKNNNKKQQQQEEKEPENLSKDGLTRAEFTLCLRIVANLSNWQSSLAEGAPKLLLLEDFAMACDRLKLEKPGKLFMELTNMQQKEGVTQAELAYWFAKRRRTFRRSSDKGGEEDDEEGEDDDDDEAGGLNSRTSSFANSARKISMTRKAASNISSSSNNNNGPRIGSKKTSIVSASNTTTSAGSGGAVVVASTSSSSDSKNNSKPSVAVAAVHDVFGASQTGGRILDSPADSGTAHPLE